MKELLTSGAVGSIEMNAQKKIRQDIQERWNRLGLVEGLQGHVKETVATLYENQAKHLIYEATSADNSGSFETVVFPLIRRVFSKLLANDIVSVQAMNLPIGKLFFIRPVTSERQWFDANGQPIMPGQEIDDMEGVNGRHVGLMGYRRENRFYEGPDAKGMRAHEAQNRYYLPDEVVEPEEVELPNGEKVIKPVVTSYMKKSLYDLFYNDFLFDNSKGRCTIKVGGAVAGFIAPNGEFVSSEEAEDVFRALAVSPQNGSVEKVMLEVYGFSSYNAGRLTGPDGNEMDTEAFLASLKVIVSEDVKSDEFTSFVKGEAVPFRVVTQKYGDAMVHYNDICTGDGRMLIEVDLTKPVREQGKTINGYIGADPSILDMILASQSSESGSAEVKPFFEIAWAQYDSLELDTEMGEVSFQLTSVTVSVEERKLRATWSPELAQDVSAFHNIDAEAELTAILSEQIAAEIDREILRDIRKAAPWQSRWDYNGWQRLATPSTVYTQKDWNQTLMTQINRISAQIQKSTLRGGADFVVVSAEISAVLNDLEYFHVTDASAESEQYNMGIEKIGSLQGRYRVVVDPYAPHWSLIMGHHGTSLLDTGYIYAPYVPMALTPTMYNPFNFAPVKGICTRYAKKLVNNKYYGAIKVDGLVYWNPAELR